MQPPIRQPTKQQVRDYGDQRKHAKEPPPSPERIREMLGWKLVEFERNQKRRI